LIPFKILIDENLIMSLRKK